MTHLKSGQMTDKATRLSTPRSVRCLTVAVVGSATATLAGCAGSEPPSPPPSLGLRCVDDSAHCISQREKVFDSYMAIKSRGWIRQPVAPEARHASGVGFAYSKRRRDLSCDELVHGKARSRHGARGCVGRAAKA